MSLDDSKYLYQVTSTFITLSHIVLTVYTIEVVIYLLLTLVTGYLSTTWNPAAKSSTLSLRWRQPDHLGHIGAGIEAMDTFEEGVTIKAIDNEKLELMFLGDRNMYREYFKGPRVGIAY